MAASAFGQANRFGNDRKQVPNDRVLLQKAVYDSSRVR